MPSLKLTPSPLPVSDAVTTRNNIALMYATLGRYPEGEELLRAALASDQLILCPRHPSIGLKLGNLAYLSHMHGKLEVAEDFYLGSISSIKQVS